MSGFKPGDAIYELVRRVTNLETAKREILARLGLIQKMTTAERNAIASPQAGLMIYNTDTNKLNVYTTGWEQITSV